MLPPTFEAIIRKSYFCNLSISEKFVFVVWCWCMDAAQHSDTEVAEVCAPREGRKASHEGHFLAPTNDTSVFCNFQVLAKKYGV